MKQKILRLCSIVASFFVLLFAIAGCGDRAILNLEIKPGTFEYTYEQDSDVSLENLIVIAHYNDETSTEVKYGDPGLTVTTFTTETTGKKDIEIKYGGKTLKVEVTVKAPSETTLLVRSIAGLPATENITTADRAAIVEMRIKYNALSEDGKAKITNYSVLQAAEAKLASLDLAACKTSAIAELNAYKAETNYSSGKWTLVVAAKEAGIENINDATTIADVNTAVANAKAAMDEIETKTVELAAHKVSVKTQFNAYVQTDYSATNWIAVRLAVSDGKEAIDAANTVEEVNTALNNALTTLNAIPTLADEFNAYKLSKLESLSNMITVKAGHIVDAQDNRLYNDANETSILTVLNAAVTSITNATTKEAIDTAYNSVVTAVNSAKLKVVTDVETLIAGLTNVTIESKTAVEAARDAYDALSSENKAKVSNYATLTAAEAAISALQDIAEVRTEWKNRLDTNYTNNQVEQAKYDTDEWDDILDYVASAKEAIDAATTSGDIIDIYNEAVVNITTVKLKVVTDVEDSLEALNKTITLEDKTLVEAARSAYEALTGAQKDSISATVYAYLTAAEAEIIRLEFEAYKVAAIATLDTKLSECGNKYNSTNYEYISRLIADAKALINDGTQVTTETQVDAIVQDVVDAIREVKVKEITDVEEAIAALLNPPTDLGEYRDAITAIEEKYEALAGQKTLVSNYNDLLAAKADLAAKELDEYKALRVEELVAYLPAKPSPEVGNYTEDDYGPTKMVTINNLKAEGIANINNATSEAAALAALESAKQAVNQVKTQDSDHYTVIGWETPLSIGEYQANTDPDNDTSKEGVYKNISNPVYYVGDDNPFKYQVHIIADAPGTTSGDVITEYRSKVHIEMWDNNDWITLRNDINSTDPTTYHELYSTYVENVDEYTFEYDFTQLAADETRKFRITVTPYYEALTEDDTVSIEFTVVNGYNVDNAKELGIMFNNPNDDDRPSYFKTHNIDALTEWKTFLGNNNIQWQPVQGIVLHKSLGVGDRDIPEAFYDENGYLIDYVDIYEHVINPGEKFNFYGNYFTIDISGLKAVNTATATGGMSHATLFKITGATEGGYQTQTTRFENATFIGNARALSSGEGNYNKGFGSVVMAKFQMVSSNIENLIINNFYLNLMTNDEGEDEKGLHLINNVKSFDAFQNHLFVYGASTVNVTNSEFKRCGGPAIISSKPAYESSDLDDSVKKQVGVPLLNVDSNTVIEAKVTGKEAWFTYTAPGVAESFTTLLEPLFDSSMAAGQSNSQAGIVNAEGYINLLLVGRGNSDITYIGATNMEGKIAVDFTIPSEALNHRTIAEAVSPAPLIIGSNGKVAFYNPGENNEYKGLLTEITIGQDGNPSFGTPTYGGQLFADCSYVTVWYQGMAVVVEYFQAPQA